MTIITSEKIDLIAAALSAAQGAMENPDRNRTVKVRTKSGSDYSFKYATLDAIIKAAKKPLAANQLAYTQVLGFGSHGKYILITRLLHSSGQWIESQTPLLVDGLTNQEFGSAMTYMKRYSLAAMLGIAADEDDDANTADGNEIKEFKATKSPPPAREPVDIANNASLIPQELITQNLPNGKTDWVEWGQRFLGKTKECFPPDREKWLNYNSEKLKSMQEEAPRVYKRLTDALGGINADQKITAG